MNAKDIASEAIARMNRRITNEIFSIIQNDRELMHEYLRAVEASGLDAVNQTIGKAVKVAYNFTNADDRGEQSFLHSDSESSDLRPLVANVDRLGRRWHVGAAA